MQRGARCLALLLGLSASCGPSENDEAGYSPSPSLPISSLARGPACSFYPCFQACGRNVAMATVEPAFGFSGVEPIPWQSGVALDGRRVGSLEPTSLDQPLPTQLWAQAGAAAVAALDTAGDVPRAAAWWFDAGPVSGASSVPLIDVPSLWLLGATQGLLVLRSMSGFSVVDPGTNGPREVFCVESSVAPTRSDSALLGDVLAIAETTPSGDPLVAHLLRISADGATEFAALPIDAELPFGGRGDRLTLTSYMRRRITSYDISGAVPLELGVADEVPTGSDDPPLGGFEFRGSGDRRVALDLQGRLERYDVRPLQEAPCLWRLEPRAGGDAFIVSPLWPETRLPAEPVPAVTCPEPHVYAGSSMALSPDESAVLIASDSDNAWLVHDVESGEDQVDDMRPVAGAILPGGDAHWIGQRVVIASTVHGDYGIETLTTVTVASASPPRTLYRELRSPGPVLTLRATSSDLWATSYARGYEGDGPVPDERVLWRLDPNAIDPQIAVVEDVQVGAFDRLAAYGEQAYLATPSTLRVISRDAALVREIPLPATATSIVGSALGVFITDGFDRLWWLPPDAGSWSLLVDDCPDCVLAGATGERVFVTRHAPLGARGESTRVHDAQLGYVELRAYVPTPSGATLQGRQPLAGGSRVFVGATRALVYDGAFHVLAPLAPSP